MESDVLAVLCLVPLVGIVFVNGRVARRIGHTFNESHEQGAGRQTLYAGLRRGLLAISVIPTVLAVGIYWTFWPSPVVIGLVIVALVVAATSLWDGIVRRLKRQPEAPEVSA